MKKVFLVDVSSLFFRAYYAIRPLTSPSGIPVNAVYGFLSMITKLLKEDPPDYIAFCYDRKEPSFRKEMYGEYKANRTEMPDDLAVQIPIIKKLIDLLGIPSLERENYEADDIIGTLAIKARKANLHAVIVSGDKDFAQLIGPGVEMYDTMKEVRYDEKAVKEKWGIRPNQMIDYLAICGDSSDNIPGVAGIGPKGALKLLEEFDTLDGIYQNLEKISSKSVKEKLAKSKELAFLSQKLVTIVTDVDVPTFEDLARQPIQAEPLRELLKELNFKTFEKNLLAPAEPAAPSGAPATGVVVEEPPKEELPLANAEDTDYQVTEKTAAELAQSLREGQEVWGWTDASAIYVAWGGQIYSCAKDFNAEGLRDWTEVLENKKLAWRGFDLKKFWHEIGLSSGNAVWDSMLAAYVIRAQDTSDFRKVIEKNLLIEASEILSPSLTYNLMLKLEEHLKTELKKDRSLEVLEKFEMPLIPVLHKMEKRGVLLDSVLLAEQSEELRADIAKIEKDIYKLANQEFNIGSPKQLGQILFQKLQLPTGKKTKTGFSTDNDVLEKIEHPIAAEVLKWRELSKLKSTYVDSLPTLVDGEGRVHTTFAQALTATGRLSSSDPNLQNIPIRTPRGQQVRQAFIASKGMKLLSVDYSQIELRILAHITEDPGLKQAFADDLDVHALTAAKVFKVPLAQVDAGHRRIAKAVNFGIAYGQGAFGLAETLGIPRGEAQAIIANYFTEFKNVKEYIEETTKKAIEAGYVETLFGRRRYLEELKSKNPAMRKFGERAAINAPIQGTASDVVKLAMIELDKQVPVPMLLQVHDELIFEAPEAELNKWSPKIVEIMQNIVKLKVPLKANYAIGNNWDEAH